MSATMFKKSAYNSRNTLYNLWNRHTIGAPVTRNQFQQHCKAYSGSKPQSMYKKVKDVDISAPAGLVSSSSSNFGLVSWYLGMIKSRPIVTKSITSALIYAVSDLTSQTISRKDGESYDIVRTLRMSGFGLIIVGTTLHHWFNFISRILPNRDLVSTLKKMFLGQAVYGPCMTAVFFSVNAALQGESGEEIVARLKRDMIPTLINCAMYWPLCDFITFKFVPVQLQPLMSNSFAYIWTVYITYMASLEKVSTADDIIEKTLLPS